MVNRCMIGMAEDNVVDVESSIKAAQANLLTAMDNIPAINDSLHVDAALEELRLALEVIRSSRAARVEFSSRGWHYAYKSV